MIYAKSAKGVLVLIAGHALSDYHSHSRADNEQSADHIEERRAHAACGGKLFALIVYNFFSCRSATRYRNDFRIIVSSNNCCFSCFSCRQFEFTVQLVVAVRSLGLSNFQ